MPLYSYRCDECSIESDIRQELGSSPPDCCGYQMERVMTFPAMVKVKGSGGYPSRRKMMKDTAPYCRG